MKIYFCVYKKQYAKNKYKKKSPQKGLSRLATHKKAPLARSLLGSTYSVKPRVTIKRCRSVFGQSICFANGNARHFATQNWLRQPLFGGCIAAPFSSGCSAVFSARGHSICYANGYAAPFSSGCSTKTATKNEDSFRSPKIYLFS